MFYPMGTERSSNTRKQKAIFLVVTVLESKDITMKDGTFNDGSSEYIIKNLGNYTYANIKLACMKLKTTWRDMGLKGLMGDKAIVVYDPDLVENDLDILDVIIHTDVLTNTVVIDKNELRDISLFNLIQQ